MDINIGSMTGSAIVLLIANRYTTRALDKIEEVMKESKKEQHVRPLRGTCFTVRRSTNEQDT